MKARQFMDKLLSILSHRREHNSTGELSFALKFLSHCEPLYDLNNEVIAYRFDNTHPEDRSRVLFSCHIDTMHRKEPERVFQEVFVDSLTNQVFINSSDDCLGADDGAGVYLLLEMIERDVHGCFLFHRGEEKGGIGSRAMSSIYADWLKTFTHAIAFDRRGARSVITHQGMNRGASDKCAQFIIDLFGMNHELDDTGTYTDTREYFGLIPECFNFSIGYDHEHSSREILDLDYLMKLKDKITSIEWGSLELPIDREPKYDDYEGFSYGSYYGSQYDSFSSIYDNPELDEIMYLDRKELAQFIKKNKPEKIADMMSDLLNHVFELEDAMIARDQYYSDDYADYHSFNDDCDRPSLLKAPIQSELSLDLENDELEGSYSG